MRTLNREEAELRILATQADVDRLREDLEDAEIMLKGKQQYLDYVKEQLKEAEKTLLEAKRWAKNITK